MGKDSHVIQRAILELMLPSADNAFATQNKAANIFKQEILPLIEKVLDDLDVKGEVIRLDRLALNVNLKTDDFSDPVFLDRVKMRLRDQLEKAIGEAKGGTQMLKGFGKVKKLNAEHTDEELFLYLLRHGHLPWWVGTRERIELDALAAKVLEKPSAEFRARLVVQIKRTEAVKRLAYKLSPENFSSVIALVSPYAMYALEIIRNFSEIIRLYSQGNDAGKRLREQLLHGVVAGNISPVKIISEFIKLQNDVELVRHAYLHFEKKQSDSDAVLQDIIKRALVAADAYYKSEIRKFFSQEDIGKYFTDKKGETDGEGNSVPRGNIGGPADSNEELYNLPDAEDKESWHVNNAGVIILAAFLPAFFKEMNLLEGEKFRLSGHAGRAAYLIQHLATGEEREFEEHEMALNKILCGIDMAEPLTLDFVLSEKEREEAKNLLDAAASHWSALRGASGESMRQTFFNREASFEPQANGWNLRIEKQTFDILVDKLPWGISLIKLPWMQGAVFVDW
jgi:hypothetical protein